MGSAHTITSDTKKRGGVGGAPTLCFNSKHLRHWCCGKTPPNIHKQTAPAKNRGRPTPPTCGATHHDPAPSPLLLYTTPYSYIHCCAPVTLANLGGVDGEWRLQQQATLVPMRLGCLRRGRKSYNRLAPFEREVEPTPEPVAQRGLRHGEPFVRADRRGGGG